jgi:hypothetical protein
VGEANVFTATVVPPDIAQPIMYTWQASGQIPITETGGLSDSVGFTWGEPGTQVITVTVSNILGSTADHFTLPVFMPPSNLEISGDEVGSLYGTSTFTATVTPINTTVPLTYEWTVDNQSPIVHTNGMLDILTLTWEKPGLYQLSVSATNAVGIVVGSWDIEVYVKIFMPIGLRY